MKLDRIFRKRLLGVAASVAVLLGASLSTAGTAAATAEGGQGWYQLCSRGTYASYMTWPTREGFSSYVANPGQCVAINLDGSTADIYGLYPGGYPFHVGSTWSYANIATAGHMGPGGYYWYPF